MAIDAATLAAWVSDARRRTVALHADRSDAELAVPYLRIINPPVWELGHVAWFQEHWVLCHVLGQPPIHDGGDPLWNSTVIPHARRWTAALPSRAATLAYLELVHDRVLAALSAEAPIPGSATSRCSRSSTRTCTAKRSRTRGRRWAGGRRGCTSPRAADSSPQGPGPATSRSPAGGIASGPSAIIIVHYDSIGPKGTETANPGVDDDMSGMSILLETARLFVAHKAQLGLTVRFVASDEEELGGLAGARNYATYITGLAQTQGFQLIAAIDDEQSGWNCSVDNRCGDNLFPAVDIYSCGGNGPGSFDYGQLGNQLSDIVTAYSPLKVKRGCLGANSDHFAFATLGVPALTYSEHNPFANPHFDQEGGDTFDKIDLDYLISIARPGIAFQAALAGLQK